MSTNAMILAVVKLRKKQWGTTLREAPKAPRLRRRVTWGPQPQWGEGEFPL